MTIDEAIAFCVEKSNNIKLKAEPEVFIQIAEWLEELKAIKDGSIPIIHGKAELELHDKAISNNAIDDFANACKSNTLCQTFGLRQCDIDKIAEQLKENGRNEDLRETSCGYSKEDIELNRTAMYNKAIDDFIYECDKYCGFYTGDNKNLTREDMLNIAEKLKEGGNNERKYISKDNN